MSKWLLRKVASLADHWNLQTEPGSAAVRPCHDRSILDLIGQMSEIFGSTKIADVAAPGSGGIYSLGRRVESEA